MRAKGCVGAWVLIAAAVLSSPFWPKPLPERRVQRFKQAGGRTPTAVR